MKSIKFYPRFSRKGRAKPCEICGEMKTYHRRMGHKYKQMEND